VSWNIGHRGAAGLEPENTLRSFRRAEDEGADILELDLHLTRDGHLVVLHDPDLDRTTNGTGAVADAMLDDLRQLDAGMGERIPTLQEVLEATSLPIHAELKVAGAASVLAEFVRAKGLIGFVTPISFHPGILRGVKFALPSSPTGLIFSGAPPDAAERARAVGATLASLEGEHANTEVVQRCRRFGLQSTVWTVNDPGQMQRVLELDLDGVVTDRPDLLATMSGVSSS
jgi:glycerophosphoryl diester phosphodiesterase